MTVAVVGLWHLGTVTAACLASLGPEVVGFDEQPDVVAGLSAGRLPVFEPGLEALVREGIEGGRLRFTSRPEALAGCDVVWIAYDTPVDEEDQADVEAIVERVAALLPFVSVDALVLVSAQLPIGTTRRLEAMARQRRPANTIAFACVPENLVLGRALDSFLRPERIVVGLRSDADRDRLVALLTPITERIEWMSVESAEMTKHALNAYLATSIAFTNEIAAVCEHYGADAREVERGLRTDGRVGPRAYVRPGAAFAGGTLARDLSFLSRLGEGAGQPVHLLRAALRSNEAHKSWPERRLKQFVPDLSGRTIAVLGLTYKPGTDTLRRSSSIEVCRRLGRQGARIKAYDPAVTTLPPDLDEIIELQRSVEATVTGSDAVLLMTEWPDFRAVSADEVCSWTAHPVILDAGRFLEKTLGSDTRIQYLTTGRAS
jgi:UDPglucose 6-dehydrogenase